MAPLLSLGSSEGFFLLQSPPAWSLEAWTRIYLCEALLFKLTMKLTFTPNPPQTFTSCVPTQDRKRWPCVSVLFWILITTPQRSQVIALKKISETYSSDDHVWLNAPFISSESHRFCDRVQDAYTMRCCPQVKEASMVNKALYNPFITFHPFLCC